MSWVPEDMTPWEATEGIHVFDAFGELCTYLIEEQGYDYLNPRIHRVRSTGWLVYIYTHHEELKSERLAFGQMEEMDQAIHECIEDFKERQRVAIRKTQLLDSPDVREALELYGVNVSEAGE